MNKLAKAALRGAMICAFSMSIGGAVVPASAATSLPQSWNGYKWARTGLLAIPLTANVSASWMPYVATAAAAWSAAPAIDYMVKAGNVAGAATCAAAYGTLQVCNANYGATGWVGYTQVWTIDNNIVMATVKLNEYYFAQPKYNTTAYRQLVACQELGNALGLDDIDHNFANANLGSCTDYTNDPTGKKGTNGTLANLTPSASDMSNLNNIYAKLDTTQLASTVVKTSGNAFLASAPEPSSSATRLGGFSMIGAALPHQRKRRSAHH